MKNFKTTSIKMRPHLKHFGGKHFLVLFYCQTVFLQNQNVHIVKNIFINNKNSKSTSIENKIINKIKLRPL